MTAGARQDPSTGFSYLVCTASLKSGGAKTTVPNQETLHSTKSALAELFQKIAGASLSVLMLDYDGTLAPFRDDPTLAVPYPGVRDLLRQIRQCRRTRVVFVSGRQAREVQRLVDIGGVEIWGCHGLEKLNADGVLTVSELDASTRQSLAALQDVLLTRDLLPFTEIKPTGYAVHWRGLPSSQIEEIRQAASGVWEEFQKASSLRRLNFDGGIEICASAMNKGNVVERIVAEFPAGSPVAYLGDDVTDEDAFRALRGNGLGILVRDMYRETAAAAWLRPPRELLAFLQSWTNACKENHASR